MSRRGGWAELEGSLVEHDQRARRRLVALASNVEEHRSSGRVLDARSSFSSAPSGVTPKSYTGRQPLTESTCAMSLSQRQRSDAPAKPRSGAVMRWFFTVIVTGRDIGTMSVSCPSVAVWHGSGSIIAIVRAGSGHLASWVPTPTSNSDASARGSPVRRSVTTSRCWSRSNEGEPPSMMVAVDLPSRAIATQPERPVARRATTSAGTPGTSVTGTSPSSIERPTSDSEYMRDSHAHDLRMALARVRSSFRARRAHPRPASLCRIFTQLLLR